MVKPPFPKMGIMKRTTKGKEYAWLYDLRVCLKQNCEESNSCSKPIKINGYNMD